MAYRRSVVCEHGTVVDWGGYGPCGDHVWHPVGGCPNLVVCPQCFPDWPDPVTMPFTPGPGWVPHELPNASTCNRKVGGGGGWYR